MRSISWCSSSMVCLAVSSWCCCDREDRPQGFSTFKSLCHVLAGYVRGSRRFACPGDSSEERVGSISAKLDNQLTTSLVRPCSAVSLLLHSSNGAPLAPPVCTTGQHV